MAPLHAPFRTIYPVRLLSSLLPSIMDPAKRFLLGNSKTSSFLVLCCPFFRLKFFISWLIVRLLPVFGAPLNLLLSPHPTLGSCNYMALFKIFDKVMILLLSTCNMQKVYLMNWLRLVDPFLSLILTYMCFGDFAVNFVIWLQVCQPKLTLFRTLSFIVTCLLMNSYIAARSPPVCLLHPYCPPLHSLPQYMLPNVVFLGLITVVSRLIRVEDEGMAGGILATTFLSPVVIFFMVLVVVLLGSNPAVTVDSGSTIHTVVQQQISGHDRK